MAELQNANPIIYETGAPMIDDEDDVNDPNIDESSRDSFSAEEVFELIRHLNDPEHPLTLEQLKVLTLGSVQVDDSQNKINILFTPTIPHCSMATLIGLCIRVKLLRSLPIRFKVTVKVSPGSHQQEESINKQLNDKERVAAALENAHLLQVVEKCIANTDR